MIIVNKKRRALSNKIFLRIKRKVRVRVLHQHNRNQTRWLRKLMKIIQSKLLVEILMIWKMRIHLMTIVTKGREIKMKRVFLSLTNLQTMMIAIKVQTKILKMRKTRKNKRMIVDLIIKIRGNQYRQTLIANSI